jgi:hypothetical protein
LADPILGPAKEPPLHFHEFNSRWGIPKHSVNPVEYLTDVLLRIHDHPKARIAELLPHRWKMAFAKSANDTALDPSTEAT